MSISCLGLNQPNDIVARARYSYPMLAEVTAPDMDYMQTVKHLQGLGVPIVDTFEPLDVSTWEAELADSPQAVCGFMSRINPYSYSYIPCPTDNVGAVIDDMERSGLWALVWVGKFAGWENFVRPTYDWEG